MNLARAEREAGRLYAAIQAFQRVVELERNAPDAWSMLSNALREAGRFEEALGAARSALQQSPWHGQAHLNEGAALHCLGQLAAAVPSYWVATTHATSRSAAALNLRTALGDPRCAAGSTAGNASTASTAGNAAPRRRWSWCAGFAARRTRWIRCWRSHASIEPGGGRPPRSAAWSARPRSRRARASTEISPSSPGSLDSTRQHRTACCGPSR